MNRRALSLVCLLPLCAFAHAKPAPELHSAKVISQNIGSYNGGTFVTPIGASLVGAPIRIGASEVVVETEGYRYTWQESTRSPNWHHFVVLPVNGTINYFRDGNSFVVVDSDGKKHKFVLLHAEEIEPTSEAGK